ncbi:MAG: S1 RNA-binding domain-containing protein [Bdellovibrionota bacterium]
MARYQFIDPEEQGRDPFASDESFSSQNTTEFETMLQSETDIPFGKKYKPGEPVAGSVASVGADFIFVDLGGKNAASISCDEFLSAGMTLPKMGERITAYVRTDNGSEILLTRSLKRGDVDELLIRNAFESKIPVEAKIEKINKGGFEATIGSKRCFVPMSGMELHRIENPDVYIGSVFQFHIIEMKGRNIVLSRKSLLREEQETKAAKTLELIQEGQIYKATVTKLMNFGAFASMDGLEGLISMNELSAKRVKNAEEVVKVGDVVSVRVLRIERSPKLRIALSLKDGSEGSQWSEYQDKKVTKTNSQEPMNENNNIFAAALNKAKRRN